MTDNTSLEGWHTPIALAAVRGVPIAFREVALSLHDRQIRCRMPRPGGASRAFQESTTLACGTSLTLEKQRQLDGGRMRVVLGRDGVTLIACNLRLLRTRLPETIVTAAEGMRLGDIVSLGGILARLENEKIMGISDHDSHQLITLDMPSVDIRRDDIGADTMGDAR